MDDKTINITNKNNCCGCSACYNICPTKAISMVQDSEGFFYPEINKKKCINCGQCKKVCPFININNSKPLEVYNAHIKNEENLIQTSSGGIFSELAKSILKSNGIVIAVNNNNEYEIVDNVTNLSHLYGSKYVQVFPEKLFKKIKELLNKNNTILFVGTPCCVNGLKNYLSKEYENLYTCDLICHGVPSKLWLDKYKASFNKKITSINYREKSHGWQDFSVKINFDKKSQKSLATDNEYMRAFLDNLCLRYSCYECKAKNASRSSDLTLGDYWGIDKESALYNFMGNSIIIVNSDKGKKLFEKIKDEINLEKINKEEVNKNTAYSNSVVKPKAREEFYIDLNKMTYKKVVKKYKLSPKFERKLKIKIKNILGVK